MKKPLIALSFLLSFSALAAEPQITDLSKSDVKDVAAEFGANFAHTTVAAPETDGVWGVEVGVLAGQTKSPKFSDVIEDSGGNGSDFENLYHAGLMARAHLPYDIFVEASMLPEQDISDVKIKSQSMSLGWNAGSFFSLPLDVALGLDYGTGEIDFHQDADIPNAVPESDINFKTKTTVYWAGISKTFWIVTPYVKAGISKINGELDATGNILEYSQAKSETVDLSGGFMAAGVNLQLALLKLGVEMSKIQDTSRMSAKLSLDF